MPLVGSTEYFAFWGAAGGEPEYVGATMIFQQTSAPTGWTKDTTLDDLTLRVTNSTGGGTGGSTVFTTIYSASRAVSGTVGSMPVSLTPTTITSSFIPSHSHGTYPLTSVPGSASFGPTANPGVTAGSFLSSGGLTASLSGSGGSDTAHTHTAGTYSGSFSGTAINMGVKYVDFIIASKG